VQRDPETLWGPLLNLLTRGTVCGDAGGASRDALLAGLAMHAAVSPLLRLVAHAMIGAAVDERNGTPGQVRGSIRHTGLDSPGS
jgi:hypothetical protein